MTPQAVRLAMLSSHLLDEHRFLRADRDPLEGQEAVSPPLLRFVRIGRRAVLCDMHEGRMGSDNVAELTLARLRTHGYRITGPRVAVVEALASSPGHQSAEEILARVRDLHPAVGRASVFRTLQLLLRAGLLLSSSRAENRTTYLLSPSARHHHLVCTRCGRTIAFDECVAEDLEGTLAKRYGFCVSGHQLEVFGSCKDCRLPRS